MLNDSGFNHVRASSDTGGTQRALVRQAELVPIQSEQPPWSCRPLSAVHAACSCPGKIFPQSRYVPLCGVLTHLASS